jgi:hypothetical protein
VATTKSSLQLALVAACFAGPPIALAQPVAGQGCGEALSEQLRRFNETCLRDLVAFVAAAPKASARVASEKDKIYIKLMKGERGLRAEAVSKANYPFMRDEAAAALKANGWSAPDNEFGDFWRLFSADDVRRGGAAQELEKALRAYGLSPGEALSVSASDKD